MRWFLRGCVLSAALGLFVLLEAGCAQSNESYANIEGQAPPDGGNTSYGQASKDVMGGGSALKSQNYPGSKRKR